MFNLLVSIDWRQPLWLLVAIQPFLLWLILRFIQKRSQHQFADKHLLPWIQVRQNKTFWQRLFSRDSAYFLAWLLFALSLAGPRLPDESNRNQNKIVLDIMMVVDLSRSMYATDIKPSRLRRTTLEAYEFLSLAKNVRVGITVYAARSHLFVPLTSDFKALKFYLKNLDSLQLPTQGGDAGAALAFAQKELRSSEQGRKQVMLWLSDGDNEPGNIARIEKELKLATESGIDTYIFGLGTEEGAAIPLKDGSWLESEGQAVISKMDANLLSRFAKIATGRAAIVSDNEDDWQALYQDGMLASLPSARDNTNQQWKQLYQWTLFPAILLLVIALIPFTKMSFLQNSSNVLLVLFTLIVIAGVLPVSAKEKPFEQSVQQGIKAYVNKDFVTSKRHFISSVLSAETDQERGIALHNLGNAIFKTGDYSGAAELFTDALRYIPEQQKTVKNQQLSIGLFTLLERRRKRARTQGDFSTPNDFSPLFDLPEQIPFMLNTKAVNLLKAGLPELPTEELRRLLDKDIQAFKLLQGDDGENAQKKKIQQDTEQARIQLMQLEDNQSNALWKRLFEIEEGFPGQLEKPKTIPGVRPW